MIELIGELIQLANKRGYTPNEIDLIQRAYVIASVYSKGRFRYRIKHRPFINHLVSTCGFLVYSNTNIETVVAGLLHSVKDDMPKIYSLNRTVGEIVDNYFDTHDDSINNKGIKYDTINKIQFAVNAIQIANSADMLMAGEITL